APPASAAEAEAALPPHDAAVRRVVLGIVSFTRWPTQPARLRLCIVGRPDYAGGLIDTLQAGTTPLDVQRIRFDERALGSACDVVYLGMLSDDERAQVRRAVAGHPVLTIAEHDPSCIAGGMFCLNVDGEPVTFDINLDAVARSGVRVHPNVLNLARRPVMP
ncbi:YfiR family protein, partial [Burkholderia sp. HMSC10F09]